jgi:threonine dehydratase
VSVAATDILAARRRIRDHIRRTPLVPSAWLSTELGTDVRLKLETHQITGSFKLRGAFNATLARAARAGGLSRPLVTASAGNHGRALAYAAERLGVPLIVYAPRNAPRAKLDAIAGHGADLRLDATDYEETERLAKAVAARGEAAYISPYSDPDVIAGAGTVAIEIFEDWPDADLIVVPVGGGGLISGVAIAARAIAPAAETVGVEVEASHVFHDSLAAGHLVEVQVGPTLADGLAGNADPETITFAYIQKLISRIVLVSEPALTGAVRDLAGREHEIVEGAGAVGVAALAARKIDITGRKVAVILSGRNIDLEKLTAVLAGTQN